MGKKLKHIARSYTRTIQGAYSECLTCGYVKNHAGNASAKKAARRHTEATGHTVEILYYRKFITWGVKNGDQSNNTA